MFRGPYMKGWSVDGRKHKEYQLEGCDRLINIDFDSEQTVMILSVDVVDGAGNVVEYGTEGLVMPLTEEVIE